MTSRSGKQQLIEHGDQQAVVTEVGATLRSYEVGGHPLCWGFSEDELSSGGRGQVLAPWPNRIGEGRYGFQGVQASAPWDEPERRNAIHGLVRWMPFSLEQLAPEAVLATCQLLPRPAYPFSLRLEVEYRLGDSGLEVRARATNTGEQPAPFGLGFHDYLLAGPGGVDALEVNLHARRRLLLDDHLLPVGEEEVAGTPYEVVAPRGEGGPVGSLRLDDCFTDLLRDEEGRWEAEVGFSGSPLAGATVWADRSFGFVMCFSGDTLQPEHRRKAIAIEPMTCPPDAFRSGEAVIPLDPGEPFEAIWGITPRR